MQEVQEPVKRICLQLRVRWSLGDLMGDVAAKIRVTLKQGVDVERVKKDIEEKVKPQDIREVPIGFGVTQMELLFVFKGGKGDTDKVEAQLKTIEGVNEVTTEEVTLI